MNYTVEKIASNKMKLSFVFSAEEFDQAMDKSFLKNRGRINVPGFRKGKAPRKLIERMYGESVFYEDAFDVLFPDAYDNAIEKDDIRAVDQPEVNVEQIGAGQELKVTAEVFVYPDVKLGAYKELEVTITPRKVTDAEIDARIQQDRTKVARTVEVLDRPVEKGDVVKLDYAGSVDGVAFDGGTAQDQTLEIGSGSFIPGFEDQLVGMCVAEEKDIQVTFPENYHAAELAGKDAVFHVKINRISKTEMPELDDEFAADVSDFTSFADYKQSIREQLEKEAEENNRIQAENAVLELAADNAEVELPDAMVKREMQNMMRRQSMQMAYQGFKMEDFLKYTGQTAEQFMEGFRPDAIRSLKIQLVMEAITKEEGVEATDEDLEAEIERQAKAVGQELDAFKSSLNDSQKQVLKENAATRKVIDQLVSSATVIEKAEEEAAAKDTAE